MVFLVGILSVQEDVTAMRTVIVKNQTSLLVMEGRMVRMSCRTEKPWFFCLWNSPNLEQSCAIQYHQPTSVCTKSNRTRIIGERNACDLEIEVRCGCRAVLLIFLSLVLLQVHSVLNTFIHAFCLLIQYSFLYNGFFSLNLLQIVFANFSSASIRFNFHIVIWVWANGVLLYIL